jgi:esterase/lipase superfamily enzyme
VKHKAARDKAVRRGEVDAKATKTIEGWLYPVFFGTNRVPVDPDKSKQGFSNNRSSITTYGRCEVWIPVTHKFGETGNAWWKRWKQINFDDDHLRLESTSFLSETDIWSCLRREMEQAEGQRHGLVFLHGYRVSFRDAAARAAQMGFDLKVSGATTFFSWPSKGALHGYGADAAAIEASEGAITQFLADFAAKSGAEVVHLVAHSMGNRGLLRALQHIASDAELAVGIKFGQIFLAAPDVDRDLFLSVAQLYPRFSERTTLYASRADKALALSSWLHNFPRAGYYNEKNPVIVAAGVDRLDTVAVPFVDSDWLGHSYFAEGEALLYDMAELMRHGTPPNRRQRLFSEAGYWVMKR